MVGFRYLVTHGRHRAHYVLLCADDDTMNAYIEGLVQAKATVSPTLNWVIYYIEEMTKEQKDTMLHVMNRPTEWRIVNGLPEPRPTAWVDVSPDTYALGDQVVVTANFSSEPPAQPKLTLLGETVDSPVSLNLVELGSFTLQPVSEVHVCYIREVTV